MMKKMTMTMTMTNPTGAGQWGPEETRELIAIRGELEMGDSIKGQWEAVSLKMTERGFNRTPEQCKCKWKNLLIRYKGKETSDAESGPECPFFNELHAVFTERAHNMQRLLVESEGTETGKRKSKVGGGNGKGKKLKDERVTTARASNAGAIQETVKELFEQQRRMEVEWKEMVKRAAEERWMLEQEWRGKMELVERERLMVDKAWREREEERRMREEGRAERRDALLTIIFNKLINQT